MIAVFDEAWCDEAGAQPGLPRCFPCLPAPPPATSTPAGGESPPHDRPSSKGSLLGEGSQGVERDLESARSRERGTEKHREMREEEGKRSAVVTWDPGGRWGGE